ncbi:MAG: hypothetical protein Kow0062_09770 [Acidobacteriota bacterium]
MKNIRILAGLAILAVLGVAVAQAQVVRQVTDSLSDKTDMWPQGRVLSDGSSAYVPSTEDRFGDNPAHESRILRFDLETGAASPVAGLPGEVKAVTVDDAGQWLAFVSSADPLGSNHDRSEELFVARTDGSNLTQLTDFPLPGAGYLLLVRISGNGSRVLFCSDYDLGGLNPGNAFKLWLISRDGSGLTPLADLGWPFAIGWDISDDGSRVVFLSRTDPLGTNPDGSSEAFAVNGDGSGLRQVTSGLLDTSWVSLSGDGSTISLVSASDLVPPGNLFGIPFLYAVNWDGTGMTQLMRDALVFTSTITDDGQTIFFSSNGSLVPGANTDRNYELWAVQRNGSGMRQVTDTPAPVYFLLAFVSGSGNRLLSEYDNGVPPGGHDPDRSGEVVSVEGDGSGLLQLSDTLTQDSGTPDVTGMGEMVVFVSHADLVGQNATHASEVFAADLDGENLRQLTAIEAETRQTVVSGNGGVIVFASDGDPVGLNADRSFEVFAMDGDGANIRQLTNGPEESDQPAISQDGTLVAFGSFDDLDGSEGAVDTKDVFVIKPDGTGLRRLTTDANPSGSRFINPQLDRSGTWVVFQASGDLAGTNPDGSLEIFRARTDGSVIEQITDNPADSGWTSEPTISGSGRWIAFASQADPLGTNPDAMFEVFLYDTQTATLQQITADPRRNSRAPVLSDDDQWLFFTSDAPLLEPGLLGSTGVYRVPVGGGPIERVSGLGVEGVFAEPVPLAVGQDGRVFAWSSSGSETGGNVDHNLEIFTADMRAPASIDVRGMVDTVVAWTPEAGPVRYDVIRGDVAQLGEGDLGPVVCVEDDSPDPDTVGYEDAENPSPGQAFFYVYRGTEGSAAGPGSWGRTSNGTERQPGSGSCLDN